MNFNHLYNNGFGFGEVSVSNLTKHIAECHLNNAGNIVVPNNHGECVVK